MIGYIYSAEKRIKSKNLYVLFDRETTSEIIRGALYI